MERLWKKRKWREYSCLLEFCVWKWGLWIDSLWRFGIYYFSVPYGIDCWALIFSFFYLSLKRRNVANLCTLLTFYFPFGGLGNAFWSTNGICVKEVIYSWWFLLFNHHKYLLTLSALLLQGMKLQTWGIWIIITLRIVLHFSSKRRCVVDIECRIPRVCSSEWQYVSAKINIMCLDSSYGLLCFSLELIFSASYS